MSNTFKNTLIQSIRDAAVYDSGSLQPPVAILWPDPEMQWEAIIDQLQQEMPELLQFGEYDGSKRQGPAIWPNTGAPPMPFDFQTNYFPRKLLTLLSAFSRR